MADNNPAGFTQGNNTVSGQQGGMAVGGGQPFDVMQWLQSVGQQMSTPQQGGNSQGGMALPPAHQAVYDGVVQGLKKSASEAASTGGLPAAQHIMDSILPFSGGGNPSGGASGSWSPDPVQLLSTLTAMASQPNNQNNTSNDETNKPTSIDDQISNINKQAQLNIAQRNLAMSKPPNFLQRFGQNMAKMEGGVTQEDQLGNIAAMQKIAGGEPLQTKDVGELNAKTYGAALEASHQAASLEVQKLIPLTDLFGKLNETKGWGAKALAGTSADQNKVLENLNTVSSNLKTHIDNLQTLINNRPTFSNKGMNSQTQATVNKIESGKVGKYSYR